MKIATITETVQEYDSKLEKLVDAYKLETNYIPGAKLGRQGKEIHLIRVSKVIEILPGAKNDSKRSNIGYTYFNYCECNSTGGFKGILLPEESLESLTCKKCIKNAAKRASSL